MSRITPRQAQIYRIWAKNSKLPETPITVNHRHNRLRIKATAKELGVSPEMVRKTVAKVLYKLDKGEQLPSEILHCYRCDGENLKELPSTKTGNPQYWCLDCQKSFVWRD